MKITFIALLALVTNLLTADEKITDETIALLCADQADNRIRLVQAFAKSKIKPTLWCYPADDGKPFPLRPTDVKRVDIYGEVHILASYHGRVKLIRFKDKKVLKDYPAPDSCHSAELLPDGNIVTVSSNDEILRVHRSEKDFTDTKLPYAHGVVWDKKRKQLWALGDALFLFDLKSEKFLKLSDRKRIKSASQYKDHGIWATEQSTKEDFANWQSDTIVELNDSEPEPNRITLEGIKFYKARWWQKVTFSY